MAPTALHEKILFLEARVAMAEDKIGELKKSLKAYAKAAVIAVELGAMFAVARFIEKHHLFENTRPK